MKEVNGDLIQMALNGEFDVIAQGCNCQCVMGSGIAKSIKETWPTAYEVDQKTKRGSYNKLGTISFTDSLAEHYLSSPYVVIVNCYTQFDYGRESKLYANYDAIAMCMDKINHEYKGKRIGLPKIGCGLANGDWNVVKKIIEDRLKDCDVTIVNYNKKGLW